MAYTLQALIANSGVLYTGDLDTLRIVQLNGGVEMIPLGSDALSRFGFDFLPLTDEGATVLPDEIIRLCCEQSQRGAVAYVEAEIFGGAGTQAFALFRDGEVKGVPIVAEDAINQALRKIGVIAPIGRDEFDYAGLGRHRDTEGWIE